jgi:putative transposase
MHEEGVVTLPEADWAEAKRRRDVIAPLAKQAVVGRAAAEEAAAQLGLRVRQVYDLIKRCKLGSGLVTDLASIRKSGGKGKSRIAPEVEAIIAEVLETLYLSREKPSKAVITREILMRCRKGGHQAPSYNTIDMRIGLLSPQLVVRKRQGGNAARKLQSAAGEMPPAAGPMEVVQIDHTPADLIVVDEISRQPIGRPSLTLAIDIYTRCIVGMLLTFEAPSATSVGLCLTHIVTDKSAWLERHGLDIGMWPMHGKPRKIHVDNATEFHSEALKRGCEQYGIELDYRPKGQPHYGGIIERVIGTAMKMVHTLPGTTFSNVQERGRYKSEAKAILTLAELEKWLILAIGTYHGDVHSTLSETPAAVWKRSEKTKEIAEIVDKKAFLIDFLPVIRRSINRRGFLIDLIMYYGDVLKPWIASRERLEEFIIRRDPRDLSRVWVLDPDTKLYLEIPYRYQSRPSVTLWEHRKAVENLRKQGRDQVDEEALFRMIEQMREITEVAAKDSRRARRDRSRRSHLVRTAAGASLVVPDDKAVGDKSVNPFEIEEWIHSDGDVPVPIDRVGDIKTIKPFDVEEW